MASASGPPTQPIGDVREFDCRDCGVRVVRVVQTHANDDDICGECAFLRTIEDPDDRANLTAFLRKASHGHS